MLNRKYCEIALKYALKLVFLKCIFVCVSLWCSGLGVSCTCRLTRFDSRGDAAFCFYVLFFFPVWSFFLTLFFFLAFFFYYSYCRPCWSCTWINIYFKLKSGVLFWKRDFKSSWSAYWLSFNYQIKTISCQDMCLFWSSWFFLMLVDIMTNTHSTPQTVLIYT